MKDQQTSMDNLEAILSCKMDGSLQLASYALFGQNMLVCKC